MKPRPRAFATLAVGLCAAACSVGQDSVLFVTNTGVGVDLDARPPTVSVAYTRFETVLQPTFEGDRVLPVLTSVGTKAGALSFGANHSFATGDAALVFGDALVDPGRYDLSRIGVDPPLPSPGPYPPSAKRGTIRTGIAPLDRERVYFGTHTSLGLHVDWTTSAYVPQAVNLGYKRKELAYVPLVETQAEYAPEGVTDVQLASLLATADVGSRVGGRADTGVYVGQLFATGLAATYLSQHGGVRRALGPALVPEFEKVVQFEALRGLGGRSELRALTFVRRMYDELGARAASDPEARDLRARLNLLAGAELVYGATTYERDGAGAVVAVRRKGDPVPASPPERAFERVLGAREELANSRAFLDRLPAAGAAGLTGEQRAAAIRETTDAITELDRTWTRDRAVAAAFDWYVRLLAGGGR